MKDDDGDVKVEKKNQSTYAEILANMGVSTEYLIKSKGDDVVERKLRKHFITGAKEPAWKTELAPDAVKQRQTMADSYSEAAASGYAPHNYKAWEPVAGLMHRWPQIWGPTVRRMQEEALRGGDTAETFEFSRDELDYILLSFPDLSPQQKEALEATAEQIAARGK
jgi:hypothetical protein